MKMIPDIGDPTKRVDFMWKGGRMVEYKNYPNADMDKNTTQWGAQSQDSNL